MLRKEKNKWLTILLIHLGALLFIVSYYHFFDGCIIKKLFHIDCPTCGVTRAWLSLFKGDINMAFYYHPFFIPLTIMFLVLVHIVPITKRFKHMQLPILIFTSITCIATLIRYFIYVI